MLQKEKHRCTVFDLCKILTASFDETRGWACIPLSVTVNGRCYYRVNMNLLTHWKEIPLESFLEDVTTVKSDK